MNWKVGLDRYLTSGPPEDGLDNWCEVATEAMTNEFWNVAEDWVLDSELSSEWFNKLFNKGKSPQEAAKIIQKAFMIHVFEK